ncbi:MAG TPA: Hsp20/alpha crystallin family protein [Anaerolineae bacterium]|nr:Hsp20/alpha crystallin family protein [Anaerolineae bacterium]HIP69774.1 Hsp20/alpha crystallin family protein [Anaerolineae bacterium]
MTDLVRWNPYTNLAKLERTFDSFLAPNLLADAFFNLTQWNVPEYWPLEIDLIEQDKAYLVKASVPGVKPDNLEVTLINNVLNIKGTIEEDKTITEKDYTLRERHFGQFARSIRLPLSVEADGVEAVMSNGILTITLPRSKEGQAHSKHIEIQHKKEGFVEKIKKALPIF